MPCPGCSTTSSGQAALPPTSSTALLHPTTSREVPPGSRAPACRSHQSAQTGCWSGWSSGTADSFRAGRTKDQRAGCLVYRFPARSITRKLPKTPHASILIHCTQAASPAPSFLAWLQRTCGGGLHQERRDSMGRSRAWQRHGTHVCVPSYKPQRATRQPPPAAAELDRRYSTHASRSGPR